MTSHNRDDVPPDVTRREWLLLLDPDPVQAERAYARLRRDLVRFLEWKHCLNPEEVADEAILRGMRRLAEDATTAGSNVRAYIFGVARMVAKEAWKDAARERPLDPGVADRQPSPLREHERVEARRQIEGVLRHLSVHDRQLLIRYCTQTDRSALIRELGVTPGHLRVMIHRIRQELRRHEAEQRPPASPEDSPTAEPSADKKLTDVQRLVKEAGRG